MFDIGNVVLYFNPQTFVRTLWKDEGRAKRLYEAVFCSPEWRFLDEGTISQEEAVLWLCRRHPEDAEHIRMVMKHWLRCLTPRWEVVELLLDMKKQGLRLYFLSNAGLAAKEYVLSTYPFFSVFDGGVFSCDEKLVKPDTRLFDAFCAKYRIAPEECIFIDDKKENILTAEIVGMKGHVFVNAERIKDMILW